MRANRQRNFVVIGNPVTHSLSPTIHQEFARQFKLKIDYGCIELNTEEVLEYIHHFFAQGGSGINITAPFKQLIYASGFQNSPRANAAKAVNTLLIDNNGKILADNTDGVGFIRDLTLRNNFRLNGRKIIIFGAGGATRGIIEHLIQMSPCSITIVNRDLEKAELIKSSVTNPDLIKVSSYSQTLKHKYDLIINATSANLKGQLPPIPSEFNFTDTTCYDLNYSKNNNNFLSYARNNGASKIIDGLGMLVEQAAEAFYLWNKLLPHTGPILEKLHYKADHISAVNVL